MNDIKTIGFIGLGTMGKSMASNLIAAGYTLYVHNRSQEPVEEMVSKGAIACHTPVEVAKNSSVVILCLPDSRVVEKIILGKNGLIEGLSDGKILIDMTTSEPESTKAIHSKLSEEGIHMLDAPISGGPKGAKEGTLSIMVGGDSKVFEACHPIFDVIGKKLYHVGDIGAGHTVKAVNNLLYGTLLVASCEAISLGVKAGIEPKTLIEVISNSSGNNLAINVKFKQKILNRDFNPGFTIDLLHKDMQIALEMAETLDLDMRTSSRAIKTLSHGRKLGLGHEDNSALIKIYEESEGIFIKNPIE
jgi:3-hydroxyisobutyrate dehydrogenase-like beta-hydroxyacid dehydrogenase